MVPLHRRAPPGRPVTDYQRGVINGLRNAAGWTLAATAAVAGVSAPTVSTVASAADAPPAALAAASPTDVRIPDSILPLLDSLDADPSLTPRELWNQYKSLPNPPADAIGSISTMKRRLQPFIDYELAIGRPPLTYAQKQRRLHFLMNLPPEEHIKKYWWWLDESTCAVVGNQYRWLTSLEQRYGGVRVGISQSNMVCGAFNFADGPLAFHVWPRGTSVDAPAFIQAICEPLYERWRSLPSEERQHVRIVMDNCGPHRAARAWLQARGVNLLDWPALSPDLSPIELLWAPMKSTMNAYGVGCPVEDALRYSWLIASNPARYEQLWTDIQENWAACGAHQGDNRHHTA